MILLKHLISAPKYIVLIYIIIFCGLFYLSKHTEKLIQSSFFKVSEKTIENPV